MASPRIQLSGVRHSRPFAEIESSPNLLGVVERLNKGVAFDEVARWLQVDCKEFADKTHRTLGKQLSRWWKQSGTTALQRVAEARESGIAEIQKLEELARIQKERIDLDLAHEKVIKKMLPSVRPEIQELRQLYHLIIDKKQSLGIYRQQSAGPAVQVNNTTTVNNTQVNVSGGVDARVAAVVQDPKARRRILTALSTLGKRDISPEEAFQKRFKVGGRDPIDITLNPAVPAKDDELDRSVGGNTT